ncbi:MAG: hypothetical protein MK110_12755 [Fuerstiella sp.]|nr:hypothetical protein [Fuerstiella sp.]
MSRFCRQVYNDQIPFDEHFCADDDKYYCAKFVDLVFRRQGVPRCKPVPINHLPNIETVSGMKVVLVKARAPISEEQDVMLPGDESYGI